VADLSVHGHLLFGDWGLSR